CISVTVMDAQFPDDPSIEPVVNTQPETWAQPGLQPGLQPGERPAILHTVHLNEQGSQRVIPSPSWQADWITFAVHRWRWLYLGGIACVALLATAALVNTKAENLEGSQAALEPNQNALLAMSTADFEALDAQVDLQLEATYERLIDLEATRFLQEAEKQLLDPSKPCYRLGVPCVLDQFEYDAAAQYAGGTKTLNRQQQLEALLRIDIVDRARTGLRLAAEPDNALTITAIQKRLEARQLSRKATAEGMAKDLQPTRQSVNQNAED
ncbi:MAG: hypothetical protein AAFN68_02270, partial [Pseudomonadota bacterium]